MKKIIYLFVFIGLSSCVPKISKYDSDWERIKSSCNYEDYELFLNACPLSENFEIAVSRLVEFKEAHYDTCLPPRVDCFRNCEEIILQNDGLIRISGLYKSTKELREFSYHFLLNEQNRNDYPEKQKVEINNQEVEIAKGFFFVFFELHEKNDSLRNILNELSKGILDYKDYISMQVYRKAYDKLSTQESNQIVSRIFYRIRIENFVPPIPPEEPEFVSEEEIFEGVE